MHQKGWERLFHMYPRLETPDLGYKRKYVQDKIYSLSGIARHILKRLAVAFPS